MRSIKQITSDLKWATNLINRALQGIDDQNSLASAEKERERIIALLETVSNDCQCELAIPYAIALIKGENNE